LEAREESNVIFRNIKDYADIWLRDFHELGHFSGMVDPVFEDEILGICFPEKKTNPTQNHPYPAKWILTGRTFFEYRERNANFAVVAKWAHIDLSRIKSREKIEYEVRGRRFSYCTSDANDKGLMTKYDLMSDKAQKTKKKMFHEKVYELISEIIEHTNIQVSKTKNSPSLHRESR
jgi:hypothetical protein